MLLTPLSTFFFFNDTATTEIYPLSLHDALPISHFLCGHFSDGNSDLADFAKERRQCQSQNSEQSHRRRMLEMNVVVRSEEHTSELQSPCNLVCRLLLEKKKTALSSYTFQ